MANGGHITSRRWRVAQWLEIRWWQNYLKRHEVDAYAQQKANYWRRVLAALDLAPPAGRRVLDAGCGPAGIFLVLNEQRVDAVDPLLDQYAKQLSHFRPEEYPWVTFHTSPLEVFSAPTPYDYTFCLNAINHVADWELGLDRLSQLTSRNGTLVIGVDVHRHAWLKRLFRTLPGDVLHPHQHDRADYRRALTTRGWRIERELTWKTGKIFDYWLVALKNNRM